MITPETISCWKVNYGLDTRTPAEAARWWDDNMAGKAPAGAVAALGLALDEIDRLRDVLELKGGSQNEKGQINRRGNPLPGV